jgi:hypothetical protein
LRPIAVEPCALAQRWVKRDEQDEIGANACVRPVPPPGVILRSGAAWWAASHEGRRHIGLQDAIYDQRG